MTVRKACLRRLRMPLIRPYKLSYRSFEEFEPFVVTLEDQDGRMAFGDGHVSPGSSGETRADGWAFCLSAVMDAVGRSAEEIINLMRPRFEESRVAATAVIGAAEMLADHPALGIEADAILPLLAPVNGATPEEIGREIEERLAAGFRCFKVKVGADLEADSARVRAIQGVVADRATLRLDANRAYSREQALRFVAGLSPRSIELFEQPCAAEDWDANAAVAAASPVPLMLDEPICALGDIDRAASIANVGFCKLKLKRFGGLTRLREGLERVRARGMAPVLGDGLGSEIHNWMEACAARGLVDNAGEFNGFLKPRERLFEPPMPFERGAIRLPAGWRPRLDMAKLERLTVEKVEFGAAP